MSDSNVKDAVVLRGRIYFEQNDRPLYKLYSVGCVMIATCIASVLLGGIFMAINYYRLGDKVAARKTLFFSFLGFVLTVVVSILIPDNVPSLLISLPFVMAIAQIMKQLQGPIIAKHLARKGLLESKWTALGISMFFVLVIGILVFVLFFVPYL